MLSEALKAGVVSFEEARRIVEEHAAKALVARGDSSAAETVDLLTARGRVLAEAIFADRDFPPFPRATRDGYAVRAADVERVPARLEVIGEIRAGDPGHASADNPSVLQSGQAVSIMTGAAMPAGSDAVVMVEHTSASGKLVEIQHSVASGENFVSQGAEAHAGQLLADKGQRLNHALIAIAAAVGKSRVEVFPKPRVAVLATGDEVVEVEAAPGAMQIRNSNSYSLSAQIEDAGGKAVRLEIALDERKRLRKLIQQGFECNLLLIAGGVSMGKYDLVEQVLGEMNAEFFFTGARIQPGKPVVFGRCLCDASTDVRAGGSSAGTRTEASTPHYFFGLPGNPVSTMVTFRLFVQTMLAALTGMRPEPLIFLNARLKAVVRTKTGLARFLPAILSGGLDNAEVELAAWQGSGDIAALARANCYLVIPPDRERMEAGELVSVLLP